MKVANVIRDLRRLDRRITFTSRATWERYVE